MSPLQVKEEHNIKELQYSKISPFFLSIGSISQRLKNTVLVFITDTFVCNSQSVSGCGMAGGYLMVLVL